MEERSVLIKMRDGEYLIVSKDQLTTNSPKFRHIFDVLKYEEHEIEDYSSQAVKTFIEFLGSKVADRLTFYSLREICKLAVVFEVNWLKEECLEWLKTSQIDPLLKLGGENLELFLKSILQNLTDQKTLDPKLRYLLQNLNLALCSEVNEELYLEVMDTVSNLSEISVADLRFVQQLTTNTARLVRSRKQERMTRKATVLWDSSNKIFPHLLKSLGNIIQAITDDRVLSMFVATEMILLTFDLIDPDFDIEEPDAFILNIEKLCSDKKMQRVSRKFLSEIISALKYSNASQNKLNHVHYLLKKIKNNNKLCANYENIVIPRQDYAFKDNDHQYLYFFKHPLSGNCTESGSKCGFILKTYEEGDWIFKLSTDKEEYANCGIHLHDYISSRDMFHYFTLSATYEGNEVKVSGTLSWWVKYFPEDWVKSITDADNFVEYNIGDYVCKL